jgi:hypothetical protein
MNRAKVLLLMATAVLPSTAQDVVRPDDTTVRVRFHQTVDISDLTLRLIAGDLDKLLSKGDVTLDARDVVVRLSPEQVNRIRRNTSSTQGKGFSWLIFSGLRLGGKSAPERPFLIPDVLTVEAVGSGANRRVILRLDYVPAEMKTRILDQDFWLVEAKPASYKPRQVESRFDDPTDPRIILFLDQQPRNQAKLAITVPDPADPAKRTTVAVMDYVKAPKATDSDPSGGADAYVSLLYTHNAASKTATNVYSTDFSFHYPYWPGNGGQSRLAPFFDPSVKGKFASKGQDDDNSIVFSVPYVLDIMKKDSTLLLESLSLRAGWNLESDKKFDNKNSMFDLSATLRPKDWGFPGIKGGRTRFYPYAGLEIGNNLHNQFPAVNGSAIRRFKSGADAAIRFKIGKVALDSVTLTGSFVYRRLFEKESRVDVKTNDLPGGTLTEPDGTLVTIPAGTLSYNTVFSAERGIRRYWKAQLRFGLTPNLETVLQYDKGSLPPQFKMVDKFQIGLAYRFAFAGATK